MWAGIPAFGLLIHSRWNASIRLIFMTSPGWLIRVLTITSEFWSGTVVRWPCRTKVMISDFPTASSNTLARGSSSGSLPRKSGGVAKSLWVQTPAYECPIEPHYMTPLIHYFPRSFQRKILRWGTLWGWIEHPTQAQVDFMVDTTRLLHKAEMRQLFPDCEIVTERMLWIIPKSYIAIRQKAS